MTQKDSRAWELAPFDCLIDVGIGHTNRPQRHQDGEVCVLGESIQALKEIWKKYEPEDQIVYRDHMIIRQLDSLKRLCSIIQKWLSDGDELLKVMKPYRTKTAFQSVNVLESEGLETLLKKFKFIEEHTPEYFRIRFNKDRMMMEFMDVYTTGINSRVMNDLHFILDSMISGGKPKSDAAIQKRMQKYLKRVYYRISQARQTYRGMLDESPYVEIVIPNFVFMEFIGFMERADRRDRS